MGQRGLLRMGMWDDEVVLCWWGYYAWGCVVMVGEGLSTATSLRAIRVGVVVKGYVEF